MSATPAVEACGDRSRCEAGEPASTWLVGVLSNAKNRELLARLESSLMSFMATDEQHLRFPPCSAFRRRVIMEVAQRFGLECRLDRPPSDSDPDAVLLVLVKGTRTAVPTTLLSQLTIDPLAKPVLVRRPQPDRMPDKTRRPNPAPPLQQGSTANGACNGTAAAIKRVSPEEYELARARIFKDAAAPPSNGALNGNAAAADGANALSSCGSSEDSKSGDSSANAMPMNIKVVGGGIARGPEEGKSFARRRGPLPSNSKTSNGAAAVSGGSSSGGNNGGVSGGNMSASDGGNNAEQCRGSGDANDPDFDRCYDRWATRNTQASHPATSQMHMHSVFSVPPSLYAHAPTTAPPLSHYAMHAQAAAAAAAAAYSMPHPPPPPPPQLLHMFSGHITPLPPPPTQHGYFTHNQHRRQEPQRTLNAQQRHPPQQASDVVAQTTQAAPQKLAPSYGLDSAADFPPLSVASALPQAKQRR